MPTVLIVCTANICRSPMAEALLRSRLQEERVPGDWRVGSAGTWAEDGLPASEKGVQVMGERGLDISGHRSRMVDGELMSEADLVLTMTASHAEALRAEFPQEAHKVFLLAEMAGPPFDIQDPYIRPLIEYRHTADQLEQLVNGGVKQIISLAEENHG